MHRFGYEQTGSASIAVWLVRGAEGCWENQVWEKSNTWIKPSLCECLNEGKRWCPRRKKPVCVSDQLQHFSRGHQRGQRLGGRLGGRTWGSLSYHLRTASLVIDSCPNIFPRSVFVLATACLFDHTHKGALVVIKASIILKVACSNYKVLLLSSGCWAPSLLPHVSYPHSLHHF